MGRELQKKNKSSIPKVRQKPKSKKKILSNPLIAANWKQDETLTQNYRRLGLVSKLNKRSGGIDKTPSARTKAAPTSSDAFLINGSDPSKNSSKTLQPEEVEVVRDPATGAIISVTGGSAAETNPLDDPLNELEDSETEAWDPHAFAHIPTTGEPGSALVQQLVQEAGNGRRKAPRTQSEREQEWIGRLVQKYGDDYEKMSRDMKLNPMQQTAGDLKRRIKKWKKSEDA